jgi:hypothetical protein
MLASAGRRAGAFGGQQFRRLQAPQLRRERLLAVDLEHLEAPAGEVERTDAETRTRFATATSRLSRAASSSDSSVSVPGVTMRVTLRSTGPLLVAGSPICSQIATETPAHQPREVALDRVVGHAGHRDRHARPRRRGWSA